MRCISNAAGTVASAVPTTIRDSGRVASDGCGAIALPTIPPKVTISTDPETKTTWARKYRVRLVRCIGGSIAMVRTFGSRCSFAAHPLAFAGLKG